MGLCSSVQGLFLGGGFWWEGLRPQLGACLTSYPRCAEGKAQGDFPPPSPMLTQAFPKAGPQAPLGPWLGRLPPAHSLEPGGPSHCQDPDDGMWEASQPLLPYRVLPGSPLAAHIPSGLGLSQGSSLISADSRCVHQACSRCACSEYPYSSICFWCGCCICV